MQGVGGGLLQVHVPASATHLGVVFPSFVVEGTSAPFQISRGSCSREAAKPVSGGRSARGLPTPPSSRAAFLKAFGKKVSWLRLEPQIKK